MISLLGVSSAMIHFQLHLIGYVGHCPYRIGSFSIPDPLTTNSKLLWDLGNNYNNCCIINIYSGITIESGYFLNLQNSEVNFYKNVTGSYKWVKIHHYKGESIGVFL